MTEVDNRRRSPRLRIDTCVAIETMGKRNECNQAMGIVRDVSRTGIGLETGQPPLKGQMVRMRMSLDDEIHEVSALTTRIEQIGKTSLYRVGLDWTPSTAEEKEFLDRVFDAASNLDL